MSHFYGSVQGSRGAATRGGGKASGITGTVKSWNASITTRLWHDEETGRDMFSVQRYDLRGGKDKEIARGPLTD